MHKFLLSLLFSLLLLPGHIYAQQKTYIPDSKFEQALIDLGIDSDNTLNDSVLTEDINTIKQLNVFDYNISSLEGIQSFDSLKNLNCSNNNLTSVNLSNNTKLTDINCSFNLLNTLDVSALTKLEVLKCHNNLLTSVDLANNTLLKNLDFASNKIISINLSIHDSLLSLNCSDNRLTDISLTNNLLLEELNCSENQLQTLDVSPNKTLQHLFCSSNKLDTLIGLGADSLRFLDCSNNFLKYLDVSSDNFLVNLNCSNNQLKNLLLGSNDSLTFLGCSFNPLKTLTTTGISNLEYLICSSILTDTLDVSGNLYLKTLDFSANFVSGMDLSLHDSLTSLNCSSNMLSMLNVKNGQNSILSIFNATNNPYLTCIEIDNITETGEDWEKDPSASYSEDCQYEYTYIPDDNFELALYNLGIDTDTTDNLVLTSAINTINTLNINNAGIENLTGIENFTALESLDCSNNDSIDILDLSSNVNLTYLKCDSSYIQVLNIGSNVLLSELYCSKNLISNLDLKNNSILDSLDATNNSNLLCIEVLDSNAANLGTGIYEGWKKDIIAEYNEDCHTLDAYVPDNAFEQALIDKGLDTPIPDNYVLIESIDTVRNLIIDSLNIFDLSGIEHFVDLEYLDCSANKLKELNVTGNTNLKTLICNNNYLEKLSVTNNTLLDTLNFGNNQIDSINLNSNSNLYKLICDANNLTALDLSGNINLHTLNCNSNNITSSGFYIRKNINLEYLFCVSNYLTAINVDSNFVLKQFNCSGNYISNLDISNDTLLEILDCSSNYLSLLDISHNDSLVDLVCNSNQLTNLDLRNNKLLTNLNCADNLLSNINIDSNKVLLNLYCSTNELTSVNLQNNTALLSLDCVDNLMDTLNVLNNTLLLNLYCSGNQLSSLDLSNNASLLNLDCSENLISSLDLSNDTLLRSINCAENNITNLNLSNNKYVHKLICNNNKLDSLNTQSIDSLRVLNCSYNNLQNLDVSFNTILQELTVDNNSLTGLDLKANDSLTVFSCYENKIKALDLSNCISLTTFNGVSNLLEILDVRNGQNTILKSFMATDNQELVCIQVDDPVSANNAEGVYADWQKDSLVDYSDDCHFYETYIPDAAFEQALIDLGYDSGPANNYVFNDSVNKIKYLIISGRGINDLTGIRSFVELDSLNIENNNIDSLDLSNNTSLISLLCSDNQLTYLDLANIDSIGYLDFRNNSLSSIDVSNHSYLTTILCDSNKLTDLYLNENPLLTTVSCTKNLLNSLYLQNSSNSNLEYLFATENPNLYCIVIDDTLNIGASWEKDDQATYNLDCHYNETYIPDGLFEQTLIDWGLDYQPSGPLDNYIPTAQIQSIIKLNLNNIGISDLTGIEDFLALKELKCNNNLVSTVDLSSNSELKFIDLSSCRLTSLNISGNGFLTYLKTANNLLTTLDITNNISLKNLDCSENNLTSLDCSSNDSLLSLNCSANQITGLDISEIPQIISVDAHSNNLSAVTANNGNNEKITFFDLRNNPNLRCIVVDDITSAMSYSNWFKDELAHYKFLCDDDDNDGISNSQDNCPNTPFGKEVDLFGCEVFRLPANNFIIQTVSETCINNNDGKVIITATENHPYNLSITGSNFNDSYKFTDGVEIRNLLAGTYSINISVEDQTGFEQKFEFTITEPQDLKVISTLRYEENKLELQMSGGNNYTVEHNGTSFKTSESNVVLELCKGENSVKIMADAACQGIYEESFFLLEKPTIYPNPFSNDITIFTGNSDFDEVKISIYSSQGQLVHSGMYSNQTGIIPVNLSKLSRGIYHIVISSDNFFSTLKIVKDE